MTWGNTIRAAVSGLTALYPAVLSPLNGDDGDQAEMATGIGRLSTAIDSLRSVSWHSDLLVVAPDLPFITPDSLAWGHQPEASSGGTTLFPAWQSLSASVLNGRLIYTVPHPQVTGGGCYLRGALVYSQHVGTAHVGVPSDPLMLEWYRTDSTGTTKIYESTGCETSGVAAYEAAQIFESAILTGSRPHLVYGPGRIYTCAIRAETGANAQIGRRIRGVQFLFSKDA